MCIRAVIIAIGAGVAGGTGHVAYAAGATSNPKTFPE